MRAEQGHGGLVLDPSLTDLVREAGTLQTILLLAIVLLVLLVALVLRGLG